MLRDRAKRTKIWVHQGYKIQITNIFKNSKFYKKNQNGRLEQTCYRGNRERGKQTKIWDHKGYYMQEHHTLTIFQNLPKISELVCE